MEFNGAKELYLYVKSTLEPLYPIEADSMSFILLEAVFGLNRTAVLVNQSHRPTTAQLELLNAHIRDIKTFKPIQYVLGSAHFYGYTFTVNEHTLVPRPETEELVRLVLDNAKAYNPCKILDIGTGSGCIPITISLENNSALVESIDISGEAIKVARSNAHALNANVTFIQADIFTHKFDTKYNIVVSNPPYVMENEKHLMAKNVLDFEPELAIFVPDHSPLLFYNHITKLAQKLLDADGMLFFEINEQFGEEVMKLLDKYGFKALKLQQDLNGKDRYVCGRKT